MHRAEAIQQCLERKGWLPQGSRAAACVRFLAQGEYNENWLLTVNGEERVLRINHGSQLGLDRQIEYEFHVLSLLAESGVTPRPLAVDPDICSLGRGALLMEYLPGRVLDYARDANKAAQVFARVHAVSAPSGESEAAQAGMALLRQPEPVRDIAEESLGLIRRYRHAHARQDAGKRLLEYHAEIMRLHEATRCEFQDEQPVLVNTEVNSGNFLVQGERAWLVDWEKAVLSTRHQDLGHFLAPTTTLWKTKYRFSPQARERFLRAYALEWERLTGERLEYAPLDRRTGILERTILLRGLSWCFMAEYEYASANRALRNADTLATIKRYLDEIECFLA